MDEDIKKKTETRIQRREKEEKKRGGNKTDDDMNDWKVKSCWNKNIYKIKHI